MKSSRATTAPHVGSPYRTGTMAGTSNSRLSIRKSTLAWPAALVVFLLGGTGLGSYSSQFGPYFLAAMLAVTAGLFLLAPQRCLQLVLQPAAMAGLLALAALLLLALLSHTGRELGIALPIATIIVVFICTLWLLGLCPPSALAPAFWLTMACAAVMNISEFLLFPNFFSTAPGRAAGFWINPNGSAQALTLLALGWLCLARRTHSWMMILSLCLVCAGVIVTFSRGGILLWLGLIPFVLYLRNPNTNLASFGVLWKLALLSIFMILLFLYFWKSELTSDAEMRLYSLGSGDFSDSSMDIREEAAVYYLRAFVESPWAGAGAFGTLAVGNGQGPHNMFVAIAADFGVLGLLVFCSLISVSVFRGWRHRGSSPIARLQFMVGLWMVASSMASHNVIYETSGAMALAMMLCAREQTGCTYRGRKNAQ